MESSSSISIEQQQLPALSDTQDYVLSIVPIPAALLSILGSVCIVRMNFNSSSSQRRRNMNKSKSRTPYNRLLIAMSLCDILYSITLAMSVFLMPQDSSNRIWAVGNDWTCSLTGFLMQFSNATIIYNTMLSFYFLLIARFGISNETITKCIEPFMHLLSIGYPLITGLVGAFMGVYSEPELSNACWVNNYPQNCGTVELDGPGASGETCISPKIAWAFAGVWYIIAFFALVGNNVVICIYVWRQTVLRPKNSKNKPSSSSSSLHPRPTAMETEVGMEEGDLGVVLVNDEEEEDDDSDHIMESSYLHGGLSQDKSKSTNSNLLPDSSLQEEEDDEKVIGETASASAAGVASVAPLEIDGENNKGGPLSSHNHTDSQLARLKLVRSQALLFVGSYMLCMIWTVTLRLVEAYAGTYEQKLAANNYTLLVLQAWFLPLQGFFNLFVYVRPKYVRRRQQNPNERLYDSLIVSVLGEKPILHHTEGAAMMNAAAAAVPTVQSRRRQQSAASKTTPQKTTTKKTNNTTQADKEYFFKRLKRSFMSSITASQGDFIENIDEDQKWGGGLVVGMAEETGIDAPQRCESNKDIGSSNNFSVGMMSIGDITKSNRSSSRELTTTGTTGGGGGSSGFSRLGSSGDITGTHRSKETFGGGGGSSSLLLGSSGDITMSIGTHRSSSIKDQIGSSAFSKMGDSSGDITQSNRSFNTISSELMKSPLPIDRMQSIAQRCRSGGHDSPLKFPHRQESKHQREGMEEELMAAAAAENNNNDNNNRRWVSNDISGGDDGIPFSPRRSISEQRVAAAAFTMIEDLPAIDEVSEHNNNRKSSASRTSNDDTTNTTALGRFSNISRASGKSGLSIQNSNPNRWQLPEAPLETSSGLDQPRRQPSDDDFDIEDDDSGEIFNPTNNNKKKSPTSSSAVMMTGIIAIVNEMDPSESSELWSGELRLPSESTPQPSLLVDRLAISEHTYASAQSMGTNRTSQSLDVALKVPIRSASEADEMDDSVS